MEKYANMKLIDANLPKFLTIQDSKVEIKAFDKLNKEFNKHVEGNYPLLKATVGYRKFSDEMVEYINLKFNNKGE